MKKFFMIAVMAVAALTASAQSNGPEVGSITVEPFLGFTASNTNGQLYGVSSRNRYGFTFGAEAMYMTNEWFGISAGIAYTQQGFKQDENITVHTCKFDYINIPILANFYVVKGLDLKVGLQPGYMVSERYKLNEGNDTPLDYDVNKFDLAIPVGLSYEFSNVVLDLRYNAGILSWRKKGDALLNGVLQFTVGYRF